MKILVYGAGVLGCNLARNLLRAGKDVTLLARGNWAAEIKQNGLRIKDKFSPRTSVSRIPVVTELAPDATYDVISAAQFPRASRVTSFPARSRFLARLHPRTPAPYTRIFMPSSPSVPRFLFPFWLLSGRQTMRCPLGCGRCLRAPFKSS